MEQLAESKREASFHFSANGQIVGHLYDGVLHCFEHKATCGNKTHTFWHGFAQLALGKDDIRLLTQTTAQPVFAFITLEEEGLNTEAVVVGGVAAEDYYAVALAGIRPFTLAARISEN